jgi:glutamate-1-semialdehyde aminotransferase
MKKNLKFKNSFAMYDRALEFFPFGTQLFSRRPELGAYGQAPIYFDKAKGAHFWDIDGNEFIDTAMAFGPISLGYCYEPVDSAVKAQIDKGILSSVNSPLEVEMAEALKDMIPCAEMIRFCKTGGEADAVAVRMARGYTGRDLVLFCGYHGWHDWYLAANLESGECLNKHLCPGISTKGVPSQLTGTAIPFEYNNIESLQSALECNQGRVACIIMEPTRFKHPNKGYLPEVRRLADEHGCVLIFDEVVTGFRLAAGGAQEYFGVIPDMATYAKAIANGYALAAVCGKRGILSSQADNFISSTYWSDTAVLAAGLATLREIREKPVIKRMNETGQKIQDGLKHLAGKHNVACHLSGHPCDFSVSFDYGKASGKVITLYMQEMIARGVYASSIIYTCYSHTDEDVEKILETADGSFEVIGQAVKEDSMDKYLKCPERQSGFRRLV